MYNSIDELIVEFLPMFIVPIIVLIMNTMFRIIRDIAEGNIEIGERHHERKENVNDLKKISIDEDLQKYFNYKE